MEDANEKPVPTNTVLEVQDGTIDLTEVFQKADQFIKEELQDGQAGR
jgi:hypothetical protein